MGYQASGQLRGQGHTVIGVDLKDADVIADLPRIRDLGVDIVTLRRRPGFHPSTLIIGRSRRGM